MLEGLRGLGKTIILTTHYMEEAEYLADRVAVIAAGRLVALGSPDELAEQQMARTSIISFVVDGDVDAGPLPVLRGEVRLDDDGVEVRTTEPTRDLQTLTAWALAHDRELRALQIARPSLEQVYLDVVDVAQQEQTHV